MLTIVLLWLPGRVEGEKIGQLIGKIQLLEESLGEPGTSRSNLLTSDLETLQNLVTPLQTEIRKRTN